MSTLPSGRQDHDEHCESVFIEGPYVWTPCDCDERAAD